MSTRNLLPSAPRVAVLTAVTACLLTGPGGGVAYAHTGGGGAGTSGAGSIGGGNQALLPINLPINVTGNAAGVLGPAKAHSTPGTVVRSGGSTAKTSGDQVTASVNAPITVCGNAVALLGEAHAKCKAFDVKVRPSGGHTTGQGGILAGNQVLVPVNTPVSVCGNVVGDGTALALCQVQVISTAGHHGSAGHHEHGTRAHGHEPARLVGEESASGHRRLPYTGAPTALIGGLGLAALAAGGALLMLARRRRVQTTPAPVTGTDGGMARTSPAGR